MSILGTARYPSCSCTVDTKAVVQSYSHYRDHTGLGVLSVLVSLNTLTYVLPTLKNISNKNCRSQLQLFVAYRRGYILRNMSLGDFVVVQTCTYTNLDTTV